MPQCTFFTQTQTQCVRQAADGGDCCRTHARVAERLGARPEGCPCMVGTGQHKRWCGAALEVGHPICARHQARLDTRVLEEERQRLARARRTEIVQSFLNRTPRPTWREVADEMWMRATLPREDPLHEREADARSVVFRFAGHLDLAEGWYTEVWEDWTRRLNPEEIWVAAVVQIQPVQPVPQRPLERLADDTQNVHREVVVTQTNSGVDLLVNEEPAEGQDTLAWMTVWWLQVTNVDPPFDTYWKVMEDVRSWYNKRSCKTSGDRLYRRALDGLVCKILMATSPSDPTDSLFKELSKRLWEECEESVGMCCEGHLARLANVLVGFDETFKSPVSPNEMLQAQIAEIAQMKLRPQIKLAKATAVMDQLGIPEADRAPWLEALAE